MNNQNWREVAIIFGEIQIDFSENIDSIIFVAAELGRNTHKEQTQKS